MKFEDSGVKNWAHVNLSKFFALFDSPSKIMIQVLLGLLKPAQLDSKEVVRAALDVLVPALEMRLPPDEFLRFAFCYITI